MDALSHIARPIADRPSHQREDGRKRRDGHKGEAHQAEDQTEISGHPHPSDPAYEGITCQVRTLRQRLEQFDSLFAAFQEVGSGGVALPPNAEKTAKSSSSSEA